MRRAGDVLTIKAGLHFGETRFKRRAVRKGAGLVGCPCAKLRIAGTRRKIRVGCGIVDGVGRTFNTNLPAQRFPVKQQGNMRIVGQLHGLSAFEIGVEYEPTMRTKVAAMPLQQHHAHRRLPIGARGRQCHRVGVIDFGGSRFGKPGVEQAKGIRSFHN